MSYLKKMADTKKVPSLKLHIHKKLAGWEDARNHKTVHASDLTKEGHSFCPREFALLDVTGKKPKGNYVGTSMRITYQTGHALCDMLLNDWAADIAIGHWKCLYCGCVHEFMKRPSVCHIKNCGGKEFVHQEVCFTSVFGYSGSIDLIVDLGEKTLRMVEVKTIKDDDFKKLVTSLAEHRTRTSLYLRLLSEAHEQHKWAKQINQQEALIFYIAKGFGCKDETLAENGVKDSPFSPFKEFLVKRDDSLTDGVVQLSTELELYRRKKGGMPQPVCPNSYCKRAASCAVVSECWSGSYPAGVK